jgi:hypothetical protein
MTTNRHTIPDGSVLVRRASWKESLEDGRLLLFRAPDGKHYWYGIDGGFLAATLQVVRDETPE